MNHLLIIIYYRHAHLFSQKHKKAKYEHKGKFTRSMPIDEASKFLLHPLQAHCMEKITAWHSRKIFLATQKNTAFITKSPFSNKILQICKNNSFFILLIQNKAISLQRNSKQQKQPLAVSLWPLAKQRNTNQKQNIKQCTDQIRPTVIQSLSIMSS